MKSATVAIVGRPSSGKSTLVNALCGGKVSIVSPVPQTTRNRVRGILTSPVGQLVFIDTPGFHISEKKLNHYMTDLVAAVIDESDLVAYVVDGSREPGDEERAIQAAVRKGARPTIICLNKKDLGAPAWPGVKTQVSGALPDAAIVEASALSGDGVKELCAALFALAPEGEQMYPEDYYTDQDPAFRIEEIVREKAILQTREEIPHALYVRMEDLEMRDEGATLWARGFIFVERESQKGIVVGRGGEKIKCIVRDAQAELSELFPYDVRLDLRVKVDPGWRKRDPLLRKLIR